MQPTDNKLGWRDGVDDPPKHKGSAAFLKDVGVHTGKIRRKASRARGKNTLNDEAKGDQLPKVSIR